MVYTSSTACCSILFFLWIMFLVHQCNRIYSKVNSTRAMCNKGDGMLYAHTFYGQFSIPSKCVCVRQRENNTKLESKDSFIKVPPKRRVMMVDESEVLWGSFIQP